MVCCGVAWRGVVWFGFVGFGLVFGLVLVVVRFCFVLFWLRFVVSFCFCFFLFLFLFFFFCSVLFRFGLVCLLPSSSVSECELFLVGLWLECFLGGCVGALRERERARATSTSARGLSTRLSSPFFLSFFNFSNRSASWVALVAGFFRSLVLSFFRSSVLLLRGQGGKRNSEATTTTATTMSGLDALGESDDVFDDDDPFAYSKSRMGKDKSSFLSYSKDASSSSMAAGNMSGLSLKERAKLMLEASKNSSSSKTSAKSAKKGRKTKTVKQAATSNAALTATGSTGGSDSLRRSGGFGAADSGGGANTPDKSLSRTGVDERWSSRFDDLDDLSIDEKDWETPEQRAEREAREAREALEIEASSIAQDDGSMHRLSHAGYGGAVDEPSSESEEEEVIDPLAMTVSQIKEVNARNQEIRQRKFEKQRQKKDAEREEKRVRLNAAHEALQAGVDECEGIVQEDEDNGDLSKTLSAKGMEEALEKLRKAMSEAEAAGIHDTPDGLLVDHGEDVVEQVEELLAAQIMREGDVARLRDIMAAAQKSGDHALLARGIESTKAAGHLSSGNPVFAEAEAVALELAEESRLRKEKAEQDAKAVALQEALQNAYDNANGEKLFSDEQRAAIPALKVCFSAAV